ncbi:GreA/GreB family elongation factor [Halobacteriovorax sp. GB3]|uniref:GreA/GreB family elongation factor n=1 Tax=Halobacteriovorax sp. GB3 TaxID=2719615 RepID=UPI002361F08A|nr:GreA/GreB family elongation factor [Halobacteriovorax sp. GB3]MDD0852786.1 GreA/GreB family elongation factor [Halobacteriovorax sp. GB3]
MKIDKIELKLSLESTLEHDLNKAKEAAKSTHDLVTADDMQQEGKYDTRRIEASYLAGAQARRVEELTQDYNLIKSFHPREFDEQSEINLGAFVVLKDENNKKTHYFITPALSGMTIDFEGLRVHCLALGSPMAQELLRLEKGDNVEIESPQGDLEFEIVEIY